VEKKSRILYIYKMLSEQTDDTHYLTIAQIIEQLKILEIGATRKTVSLDIEQLQEFGLDIQCIKSTQNRYFIKREFSLPELKMLADGAGASRFITQEQSEELIQKLTKLTSNHNARALSRQIYLSNRIMRTGKFTV